MNRKFGMGKYLGIWILAVALAYVDASAAVYQMDLLAIDPAKPFSLLPYLPESAAWLISLEAYRKVALLAVILIYVFRFSPGGLYGFLIFTIIASAWTLGYYAWLYILLGWPPSVFTFTMLFQFPVYWVSPVLCPLLLAFTATVAASSLLVLAQSRIAPHPSIAHWVLVIAGGIVCGYSFIGESSYDAGGLGPRFPWEVFWVGYLLAVLPTLHFIIVLRRKSRARFR